MKIFKKNYIFTIIIVIILYFIIIYFQNNLNKEFYNIVDNQKKEHQYNNKGHSWSSLTSNKEQMSSIISKKNDDNLNSKIISKYEKDYSQTSENEFILINTYIYNIKGQLIKKHYNQKNIEYEYFYNQQNKINHLMKINNKNDNHLHKLNNLARIYKYNNKEQLIMINDEENNFKILYEYDAKGRINKKIKCFLSNKDFYYKNIYVYKYNEQNQKIQKIYKGIIKKNNNILRYIKPEKFCSINKIICEYEYNDKGQKIFKRNLDDKKKYKYRYVEWKLDNFY